jgi:hypothetical protein
MLRVWRELVLLAVLIPGTGCDGGNGPTDVELPRSGYRGMSDASAAVAVGPELFLAADDENSVLKLYSASEQGPAIAALDWSGPLGINPRAEFPESDIEGGTSLGEVYFWITSHGRNRSGKWRANRHRLFAMTIRRDDSGIQAEPYGRTYRGLALDLLDLPQAAQLGLGAALGPPGTTVDHLAPKEKGLNIEGLTATADGQSLLFGFRNPIPADRALLIPLLNPVEVVAEGAKPQLGDPILLDLSVTYQGDRYALGIRSIEYSRRHGCYFVIGGLPDSKNVFGLFRWSGQADDPPVQLAQATASIRDIKGFTPEALIPFSDRDTIQLLSDDGSREVPVGSPAQCAPGEYDNGRCEQKHLLDARRKTFRSLVLQVP